MGSFYEVKWIFFDEMGLMERYEKWICCKEMSTMERCLEKLSAERLACIVKKK